MVGIAKIVLKAVIISALIIFLTKLSALFPFYMTIVVETFNLANIAAADNYVKEPYFDAALQGLQERPLFNLRPDDVKITIFNEDGRRAVGSADEYDYLEAEDRDKPYMQRGKTVQIRIEAWYPFEFTMWGRPVGFDVPISFSLDTIGLKYYKDLPLDDDPYTDEDLDDITYFDDLWDETE